MYSLKYPIVIAQIPVRLHRSRRRVPWRVPSGLPGGHRGHAERLGWEAPEFDQEAIGAK